MGFRTGAYAKVWSIEPKRDTVTSCRISIAKKNRDTGVYEQEFGGFVSFLGTSAAGKAAKLKEGDSIKLGDIDVTNRYDKENEVTYTNFSCFSFELDNGVQGSSQKEQPQQAPQVDVNYGVDSGEVEAELPY